MALYKRKPKTVEAQKYEPGMEDGYRNQPVTNPVAMAWFLEKNGRQPQNEHAIFRVPYLCCAAGDLFIGPGDYIVGEKQNRYPVCKEDFEAGYAPARKQGLGGKRSSSAPK